MKAAILKAPGTLTVCEVPTPQCPDSGVLVKITACGVCSSDIKMVQQGHPALVYPRILGHEITGVIVQSRNSEFNIGDRVHVSPGLRCDRCTHCRSGADNQCVHREIFGFTRDGGFSEYLAVPLQGTLKANVVRLPNGLNESVATLIEPLACCINAQEKLELKPDDVVWIIGAGPLGLLHCLAARHRGVNTLCMSEIRTERRQMAQNWADHVVNARDGLDAVAAITAGRGADAVIIACPQIGLDDRILDVLAPGGRLSVFCGTAPPIAQASIDMNRIHYKELKITGAYGCTAQHNRNAAAMLADTRLPVESLITGRVSLDTLHRIQELHQEKDSLKIIMEVY